MSRRTIEVVPIEATPAHEAAFARLFEACSSPCFCQYWHFEGNKNAWLARAAEGGHESRREHEALLRAGDARAEGLLAFESSGEAAGWMKLTPRAAVPKLRQLPVYRALDLGSDEGVYSVGCLLVRPDLRGQGVARALVAAAPARVRALGGAVLEAYPRRCTEPVHPEEVWMGPEAIFLEAGFEPVPTSTAWAAPYPVLRKTIDARDEGSRPR